MVVVTRFVYGSEIDVRRTVVGTTTNHRAEVGVLNQKMGSLRRFGESFCPSLLSLLSFTSFIHFLYF